MSMRLESALFSILIPGVKSWWHTQNAPSPSGSSAGVDSFFNTTDRGRCASSHMSRYDAARRHESTMFSTSPLEDFEIPRIKQLNASSGEQWEFDGVSDDGTMSFIFGFSRDPNWAFLGTGNLRVYAEFVLLNSSRYAVVDYAEESTVQWCDGYGTRGKWTGRDFEYSFEIAPDMSRASITMRNPEARAKIEMISVAPPRYGDNKLWKSPNASLSPAPHFFWVEPIPVALTSVKVMVGDQPTRFDGMGGHERIWHAFNWPTSIQAMLAVRLHIGPYALSLVEYTPNDTTGLRIPSLILTMDGLVIFMSQSLVNGGLEDHMSIRKLYGGAGITTTMINDKVTGMEIMLESPRRQKRWVFTTEHRSLAFEYFFSDMSGGTGYSGVAMGGLEGSANWTGPCFTEVLEFPEKSWLVTKHKI